MKKAFLFLSILILVSLACDMTVTVVPPTNPAPGTTDTPVQVLEPATTTPEIFISLTQAIPAQVQVNGVTMAVQEAGLGQCDLPNCPTAPTGTQYLRVKLQALNLPADQFLDYKNLPAGIAIHDNTGTVTPFNRLLAYAQDKQQLFLYFTVPQSATVFGLQWPGVAEIPLTVVVIMVPPTMPSTGEEISVHPITLQLVPELAGGVHGDQIPRTDGQDLPYFELTPGHTELTFESYILQGKFHEPKIYIFPAMPYVELVPGAFESMHRLRNVMNPLSPIPVTPDQLPAVPFFNAAQVFASNFQPITFRNGDGVRFLTQYAQYAAPVNNHEMFYNFQGFSSDGEYYIVAIFPITAPGVAESSEPGAAVPAGGIAYPDINDPNADWQGYYSAVTNLLNGTSPQAFTPSLSQLDALIQSMLVSP